MKLTRRGDTKLLSMHLKTKYSRPLHLTKLIAKEHTTQFWLQFSIALRCGAFIYIYTSLKVKKITYFMTAERGDSKR